MKRIWKKAVGVGRKKKIDDKENNFSATDDTIRSRAIRLLSGDHHGVLSNDNYDERRRGKYSPGRRRRKFNAANSYPNAEVNDDKNSVASAAVSYRYAMHEYEQTVNPLHSNDDGLNDFVTSIHSNAATNKYQKSGFPPVPSRSFAESTSLVDDENDDDGNDDDGNDYDFDVESAVGSHAGSAGGDQLFNIERQHFLYKDLIMYEERYGDSYIGESLTYMYPNGYQNMRPGSTPWKMSIGIFAFFVWLSVYIVGHCSDLAAAQDKAMDDDGADQIEIRWCGSQLLYTAWLASVVVTGTACAYCSIIGYIKARDFSVANSRSQPTQMEGRNEFYAQVKGKNIVEKGVRIEGKNEKLYGETYQDSIYQSDGNPQFIGHFVQRPNQAALSAPNR